ncbi:cytochrome P450 [Almyronema epifaneia]|uniref:Cytochrome P450 n=1 Tax=Almyronema epifaneia S1 TaxID=2991925 RepID=A0ABW6IBY2_9CYAN
MGAIPRDRAIDSTLALATEGYCFISNRCDRYQSEIFQTRLLFEKTICFRGEAAAKVFYDTEKFSRQNAAPKRVQKTLLGEGGVQGLDGETHRQRKQIFMSLMTPEHMAALTELTRQQWQAAATDWQKEDQVVLLYGAQTLLCQAVCAWAGVPLAAAAVNQRTQDLAAMIDGSGGVGPRHWRARLGRQRSEQWLESILAKIRTHTLDVPENSAAYAFAWHRNAAGELLDQKVAAVDLLNVLRPTVAIARYITFAALALHKYPQCQQALRQEPDYAKLFTQEVRRFYPFFPFASARTRQAFDWQDYHFPQGVKVLLDLYGTNHDPHLWSEPEAFQPDRFRQWPENSFSFIPQGGGDHYINHRCAGEWITIRILEMSLDFLVNSVTYAVPNQNLSINLSRMPALPKSGFVISRVQPLDN